MQNIAPGAAVICTHGISNAGSACRGSLQVLCVSYLRQGAVWFAFDLNAMLPQPANMPKTERVATSSPCATFRSTALSCPTPVMLSRSRKHHRCSQAVPKELRTEVRRV